MATQQERTRVDNLLSLKDRLRHVFNVKGRLLVAQSLLSNINEFDVKVSEIEASQKRYQSLMFLYTRIRTTANQRVVASRDAMETVSLMDAVKQELSAFKLCPECGAPVREGKYTQVKL